MRKNNLCIMSLTLSLRAKEKSREFYGLSFGSVSTLLPTWLSSPSAEKKPVTHPVDIH